MNRMVIYTIAIFVALSTIVQCDLSAPSKDLLTPVATKSLEGLANLVVADDDIVPYGVNPFGKNENQRSIPKPKEVPTTKTLPTTKFVPKIVPTTKSLPTTKFVPNIVPTIKYVPKILPTTNYNPKVSPAARSLSLIIPTTKSPSFAFNAAKKTAPILLRNSPDFVRIPITTKRPLTTTTSASSLPLINFRSNFNSISENVNAKILHQKQVIKPDGVYEYSFDTDNGINVEERGQPKAISANENAEQVSGSYSFVENGQTYTVQYVANENGFQPTGDHLPTPPAQMVIALKYLSEH